MLNIVIRNSETGQDIPKKYRPLFIVLLFLPCLLVINKNLQNDIWFLTNSGRYVFENGIPYVEPFTIHQGFEFVMQQWLSACAFWITYANFGLIGLHILVVLCYACIVFFVYKTCMLISKEYFFMSFCITMLASLMASTMMTGRPTIFSTLILIIELYLLENYRDNENKKYLIPLPLLSVMMINLHAAIWPMMFILLIPYFIESIPLKLGLFRNQEYKIGELSVAVVLMFTFGLLNPYGFEAMTYLYRSYGTPEIGYIVEEMRQPILFTFYGIVIYSCLILIGLLYAVFRNGNIKLRYMLLLLGTAFLSLTAIRNFSFFAIAGVFPLAFYLKDLALPIPTDYESTRQTPRLRKVLIGLIAICVLASLLILPFSHLDNANKTAITGEHLLRDTVQYIEAEGKGSEVVLYTGYNDGGLVEYLGIPAYIDPRAEVFLKKNNKKEDIIKEYSNLQSGELYYKDFLNKYNFTHLILTKYDILYTDLKHDKDYQITFSNEVYTLYEKKAQ